MADAHIYIDQKGDVDLVLHDPDQQQIVWSGRVEPDAFDEEATPEIGAPVEVGAVPMSPCVRQKRSKKRKAKLRQSLSESQEKSEEPTGPLRKRFRVSSRHLSFASPVFEQMLDGPWHQTTTADGSRRELQAHEWDSGALFILLNVLHGRTRQVPKEVSLEMLGKVAILVDYYKCHEAFEIFATMWIDKLTEPVGLCPRRYGKDSMTWMFISWVFQKKDMFQKMVRLALENASDPIETMQFPLPEALISAMDEQREDAVESILNQVYELRDDLQSHSPGYRCDYDKAMLCDMVYLGVLTRFLNQDSFGATLPARPFAGLSISNLRLSIDSSLAVPDWRHDAKPRGDYESCSIRESLLPATDQAKQLLKTFNVEDWPGSEVQRR